MDLFVMERFVFYSSEEFLQSNMYKRQSNLYYLCFLGISQEEMEPKKLKIWWFEFFFLNGGFKSHKDQVEDCELNLRK